MIPEISRQCSNVLERADQVWLSQYGLPADCLEDPMQYHELEELVTLGSFSLDANQNQDNYLEVIGAREKFFSLLVIDETALKTLYNFAPRLIPLDTFVGSQRVMHNYGLDAVRLVNSFPYAMGFAPDSVKAKLTNLTEQGLDAVKVVKAFPAIIGLAPDSVKAKLTNLTEQGLNAVKIANAQPGIIGLAEESVQLKLDNLTELGLDAVKVVNAHPAAISYALESVQLKLDNLTELGLDAVKVVNALPAAIGFAPDSVKAKLTNLTELGLDAVKVVNAYPAAISLAPVTVQTKLRLLSRLSQKLQWGGKVNSLVEIYPAILGSNSKRLLVLARIAASKLSEHERTLTAKQVRNAMFIPLEKYIIALCEEDIGDDLWTFQMLTKQAKGIKLPARERTEKALIIAPNMGRIGGSYLRYKAKKRVAA